MRNLLIFICPLLWISVSFAQLPDGGLVAHFPFNNSANDISSNNNNGQIYGAIAPAADRFGNPCGAFRFIGTGCYLSVANSSTLKSPVNTLAITAWVKPEKGSNSSNDLNLILLAKPGIESGTDIKPQYCFQLKRNFGDSYSTISLSNDFSFQDKQYNNHPMEFNRWYFIAVTYDDNFVQVYQDGKLIAQAPKNKPFLANDFALEIGRDIVAGKKYFNGCLDDLRIYNRGLSPLEINALYKDESGKEVKQEVTMKFPNSVEKNTLTGNCYATAFFEEPSITTGCASEVLKQISGLPSGSQFKVGRNNLVYETMLGDVKLVDSFQITVKDNELPVFKCLTDIVAKARNGTTGVEVYYPGLSVTDNCPNLKLELLQGLASGAVFPIGTTNVNYKATDASGNSSDCSFKVTVTEDAQTMKEEKLQAKQDAPVAQHIIKVEESKPIEIKRAPEAVKKDAPVIKKEPPVEAHLHKPDLIVQPVEKKTSIQKETRKQEEPAKPFKDTEPPHFACPADTIILLPPNRRGLIFHCKPPVVTDNVGVDSIEKVAGPKDGCFLQLGVHPFIYRAYDKAHNVQTCTYSVMIKEDMNAIPYTPPKMLEADLQLGSDSVHYEHKASVNNCELTVLIYDDGEQDNDSVSIIFNGEVIVNRDMIRLKENGAFVRNISLLPNAENFIIAKAWNTGRYGLNTLRIDVYEGNLSSEKKDWKNKKPVMSKILHSRPGSAGGLLLKCN